MDLQNCLKAFPNLPPGPQLTKIGLWPEVNSNDKHDACELSPITPYNGPAQSTINVNRPAVIRSNPSSFVISDLLFTLVAIKHLSIRSKLPVSPP